MRHRRLKGQPTLDPWLVFAITTGIYLMPCIFSAFSRIPVGNFAWTWQTKPGVQTCAWSSCQTWIGRKRTCTRWRSSPRTGDSDLNTDHWILTSTCWTRMTMIRSSPTTRTRWVTNTIRLPNAGSMLGQRRRRWINIEAALGHRAGQAGQQTRYLHPMLVQCSACVADGGPTLKQH